MIATDSHPQSSPEHLSQSLTQIQQNWNIDASDPSSILPTALQPGAHPLCWPTGLLEAIQTLSSVTAGQKDRAHSLLNTYFRARIREGSWSGRNRTIYASLEEEDVQKAITSVEKMSGGLALQKSKVEEGSESGRKRKRVDSVGGDDDDDDDDGDMRVEKLLKLLDRDNADDKVDEELISLPPTPHHLKHLVRQQTPPRPALPKLSSLPPINTKSILSPTLLLPSASEFPSTHDIPVYSPPKHLVQAAQRATHEFNIRRMEFENAKMLYEGAKQRYMDAVQRMEVTRGQVGMGR